MLGVDISVQKDTVASSSSDGSVKVWSVKYKSGFSHSAIKTLPNLIANTNEVSTICRLKFSRSGDELAVPTKQQVVVLERSDNWEKARMVSLTGLGTGEILTTVDWKHDGTLLLAGTNKVLIAKLVF